MIQISEREREKIIYWPTIYLAYTLKKKKGMKRYLHATLLVVLHQNQQQRARWELSSRPHRLANKSMLGNVVYKK